MDWDNIEIVSEDENIVRLSDWYGIEIITEDDEIIKTSDSDIINMDACDRMIIFSGQPGEPGPQGPEGKQGPPGYGAEWGNIGGTLSDQTDLQNALNAKANIADLGSLADQDTVDYVTEVTNKPSLGTMAAVNDAPNDGKEYARKNGAWSEVTDSGSAEWGSITGTLSNQTDLQNALNSKADVADLGDLAGMDSIDYSSAYLTNKPTLGTLAGKNSVDYSSSEVSNKPTLGTMSAVDDAASDGKLYGRKNGTWSEVPTPSTPEWGDITGTLADQTDLKNALDTKADTADLGDLSGLDSIDYTSVYLTNKPTLGSMAAVNDPMVKPMPGKTEHGMTLTDGIIRKWKSIRR